MVHIGSKVRHFATAHDGVITSIRAGVALVKFTVDGVDSHGLYLLDEIGDPSAVSKHFLYDMDKYESGKQV